MYNLLFSKQFHSSTSWYVSIKSLNFLSKQTETKLSHTEVQNTRIHLDLIDTHAFLTGEVPRCPLHGFLSPVCPDLSTVNLNLEVVVPDTRERKKDDLAKVQQTGKMRWCNRITYCVDVRLWDQILWLDNRPLWSWASTSRIEFIAWEIGLFLSCFTCRSFPSVWKKCQEWLSDVINWKIKHSNRIPKLICVKTYFTMSELSNQRSNPKSRAVFVFKYRLT